MVTKVIQVIRMIVVDNITNSDKDNIIRTCVNISFNIQKNCPRWQMIGLSMSELVMLVMV